MVFQFMSAGAKALVDSIGSVAIVDGQCAVPGCAAGDNWCKLTAVCSKLSGYVLCNP